MSTERRLELAQALAAIEADVIAGQKTVDDTTETLAAHPVVVLSLLVHSRAVILRRAARVQPPPAAYAALPPDAVQRILDLDDEIEAARREAAGR